MSSAFIKAIKCFNCLKYFLIEEIDFPEDIFESIQKHKLDKNLLFICNSCRNIGIDLKNSYAISTCKSLTVYGEIDGQTPNNYPDNLDEPHPAINERSQEGCGDKNPKIISLPTNQNIKLHESENALKPSHKAEKKVEDGEEEELFRKIRGILDKFTPQTSQTLVEQIKELPIDNIKKLEGTIHLIYERAVDEPNFIASYTNMCKQLTYIKVPLDDGQGVVNFRKLLLTKCQKEFEQDKSSEKKHEDKMKAMKTTKADVEKIKELQLELEEDKKKERMRQLGNIRFIGELFKLNMLIEPIMHECIKTFLSRGDEVSLECLCCLLETIGKKLEKNPETYFMDFYFRTMQKIVDKRLTSSTVRFMLQDVIDLRKNNWIPRRDENNPKTIDLRHKEAQKEAHEAHQAQNINYSKHLSDDRQKIFAQNMGVSDNGWTPTSKSSKGSYTMVDPSKLKLSKWVQNLLLLLILMLMTWQYL